MAKKQIVPNQAVPTLEKLTREQAAEYLGVSRATLETWASLGKGPRFFKPGGKVYYLVRELEAYIESRSTNCSSALVDFHSESADNEGASTTAT
jgi:excisionase family DNA binding protein